MTVWQLPRGILTISGPCGGADVEIWKHLTNPLVDMLVQFLLRDCSLSPFSASCRFIEVQMIQPKIHGPQNDIRALQQNMVV